MCGVKDSMLEFQEKLRTIKDEQAKLAKAYESLLTEYESHDVIGENAELRRSYEDFKRLVGELREENGKIQEENAKLRLALHEQMLDEKLSIIRLSHEKIKTYFGGATYPNRHRLQQMELELRKEIAGLTALVGKQLQDDRQEMVKQVKMLAEDVHEQLESSRKRMAEQEQSALRGIDGRYQELVNEDITEETVQRRIKQNRLEMKIGLNWINKLGILLILLGVGAAFKYSYSAWFTSGMKNVAFFLLGAFMLAGGEMLHRREKRVFALGLLGGGVSVWYGSIFYSYFLLNVLALPAALLLSVAVTAIAVLLSLRYHSRTVLAIGLIGGYLPLYSYQLAFGLSGASVYAAMGYLLLLNVSVLLVSLAKRWVAVNYLSFVLHIPSMVLLIALSPSDKVSMADSILTFLIYLFITLSYPLMHKLKLRRWDIALLGMNTVINCSLLYHLFDELLLNKYQGGLALAFCFVYFALARIMLKLMPEETQTRLLFLGTSMAFAVLFVPFQLGVRWLAMGWLAEALILIWLGHRKEMKKPEKAGWGIFLLCLAVFFAWDAMICQFGFGYSAYFDLKYFSITLGMVLVMLLYAWRPHTEIYANRFTSVFKMVSLGNLWVYLMVEGRHLYEWAVPRQFSHYTFYLWLLEALLTVGLAYGLSKLRLLADRAVRIYVTCLYAIGCLQCLTVTLGVPAVKPGGTEITFIDLLALVTIAAFNLLVFFVGRDLLITLIRRKFYNIEYVPLLLGIYLLGLLTVFLSVQLQLGDIGLAFSFLYLLMGVGYIGYGFRRRYVIIRRLGLGVLLLATGKMFLYDLSLATAGSKIVAYFSFGIILLAVSYVYQRISGKLEENPLAKGQDDAD